MSGSRALASARRRRAEPVTKPQSAQPPPPPSPKSNNTQVTNKMTPAAMLLSHHKIIENLQNVIGNQERLLLNQDEKISDIEVYLDRITTDNQEKRIIESSSNEESDEDHNTNFDSIERELNEIKKMCIKVQTFAVDTNIQSVEMNKRIKILEGDSSKDDIDLSEKLIENTNNIVEILSGISQNMKEQNNNIQMSGEIDMRETVESSMNEDLHNMTNEIVSSEQANSLQDSSLIVEENQ
jgi:hypothetical protein